MFSHNYLKIKFKKYNVAFNAPDVSSDNSDIKQVNAFGYYDVIEFVKEENILGFKPSRDAEFNPDMHEFKTEYVLKLVSIGIICGKREAEFWEHDEYGDIKYPFMAVVSVDLNDKLIASASDKNKLFENIKRLLTDVKNKTDYNDYVSAYFCIGYTDIVVLLQSNSLVKMSNYITELRQYTNNIGSCVSSTYTVFGLVKDNKNIYKGGFSDENINLTLRWAYKDIQNYNIESSGGFFDKLGNLNKSISYDIEYGVFDRSCKVCCSTEAIYNLYNDRNIKDNSYRSNECGIKIFNTKLSFDNHSESMLCDKKSASKEQSPVKNALNDFLKKYGCLIRSNHLHKRLFSAMKNMEEFYELIITSEHSGDIEEIVGNFYKDSLYSFLKVIEYLIGSSDNKSKQIEYFEEALEKFRNCVQFLLFDILRSDHSYFEVPSIAHPSIGSTTKLLLAYNRIVNKWNDAFSKNDGKQNPKLTFLITSGGSDGTTVTNLLWRFEDTALTFSDCSLPIIITIPEASLYDFKGTMARLAHEFFHFKGNRLRKGISFETGEKILGRYAHFYRGMFYEYLDYCCYTIGKKDSTAKHNASSIEIKDNYITSRDFEKYLHDFPVFTASDDSLNFRFKDKQLKGNGKLNYAVLVGMELQRRLFDMVDGITGIIDSIYACLNILCGIIESNYEDRNVANSELTKLLEVKKNRMPGGNSSFDNGKFFAQIYDEFKCFCDGWPSGKEIVPEQVVIQFLRESLHKNFEQQEQTSGLCEITGFVKESIKAAFSKYDYGVFDAVSLFDKLFDIIGSLPNDAYSHAISKTNIIPQGIIQLSSVFCKIAYKKQNDSREERIKNLGIVYTADNYGLDEFNITKELNGEFKQIVEPMTDYYSREWHNASLKFFLDQCQEKPVRHKPMNCQSYKQFLIELYRECYADLCALCLLYNTEENNCNAEGQSTYKFELFKEYVGAFLSEQLDIDKLFSIDIHDTVDPKIALRICAVYEAFMGEIAEGNNRRRDLSEYLVNQYEIVNNRKLTEASRKQKCDEVFNKITILFDTYKKLAKKKKYVVELVEYLSACKSYAFKGVESFDSLSVQYGKEDAWLLYNWLDIYKEKNAEKQLNAKQI